MNRLRSVLLPGMLFGLSLGGGMLLFMRGGLLEQLLWEPNRNAMLELLLVCAVLALGYRLIYCTGTSAAQAKALGQCAFAGVKTADLTHAKAAGEKLCRCNANRRFLLLLCAVTLVEVYLHQLLLPFLVSGAWMLFLAFAGYRLMYLWQKPVRRTLQTAEADTASVKQQGAATDRRYWLQLLACALPFLLVQLNRMNIAFDYDSIRYGLRSPYVLANGSFFDSLGQVNTVYTYPKGLEVLSLPLSFFDSPAYVLCFQFWTLCLCLAAAAWLVCYISGSEKRAAQSVLLLSAVCGLGNMAVTAKTDLITLLFQLLMLAYFLKRDVWRASAMAVFTLAFKPTALVFTSISWLCLAGAQLCQYRKEKGAVAEANGAVQSMRLAGLPASADAIAALLIACCFTGVMWLRTLCITGMPATSVFTSIWEVLGFSAKWPYNFSAIPSEGIDLGLAAGLLKLLQRLMLFFFCPLGADMEHVLMAWGGLLMPLLLLLCVRNIRADWRRQSAQDGAGSSAELCERRALRVQLYLSYAAVSLVSLASLFLLWQVDGNYYQLWYALTVIVALGCRSGADSGAAARESRVPRTMFALLLALSLPLTALTGWAGAVGFTEIKLLNSGSYDHTGQLVRHQKTQGNFLIGKALAQDKTNRVIAFADAPACYSFACNVQSYTDIEGSGGNVRLVKTLNDFKAFLRWADTDYIYFETAYLAKEGSRRAQELVHDLIEDGTLTVLCVEQHPLLREASQTAEPLLASAETAVQDSAYGYAGTNHCVYGKIDKARAAQPWQEPLSEAAQAAAAKELAFYETIAFAP